MPISADPNDYVSFKLDVDKERPNVRPFHLRFLTVRQRLQVDRLIQESGDNSLSSEAVNQKLSEVIKVGLINPSDFPELDDVLTIQEKWELVWAIQSKTAMEEVDRKKRSLVSTSGAVETGASAMTSSPSSSPAPAKEGH